MSAGDRQLAVFRREGRFFAIEDTCPHQGASLGEGLFHEGRVICPLHSWVFDVRTGNCPRGSHESVRTYPARCADGVVEVHLPDDSDDSRWGGAETEMKVKRVTPSLWHRLYLPSIFGGLVVTLRHMFRRKDTMQYPEQKREFGSRYRGVPALVKDQDGREKCVACYMCQWVCPPLAITIEAAEYPRMTTNSTRSRSSRNASRSTCCAASTAGCARRPVPRRRSSCPRPTWSRDLSRELMIFDKEKLYEVGGERHDDTRKWSVESKGPRERSHRQGDEIAPSTASTAGSH